MGMYQDLKDKNLCVACGRKAPEPGRVSCEGCLKNLAGQRRRNRARNPDKYRAYQRELMRKRRLAASSANEPPSKG
jgi:predicted nucleic acid-binding Zn ribbon protein